MSDPLGIDVAYPHGPDYDWRVWRGKVSFGMCKVTEGLTITDPVLREQLGLNVGLDRGG